MRKSEENAKTWRGNSVQIYLNLKNISATRKNSFSFLDQFVAAKLLTISILEDLASPLRFEWEIKITQQEKQWNLNYTKKEKKRDTPPPPPNPIHCTTKFLQFFMFLYKGHKPYQLLVRLVLVICLDENPNLLWICLSPPSPASRRMCMGCIPLTAEIIW